MGFAIERNDECEHCLSPLKDADLLGRKSWERFVQLTRLAQRLFGVDNAVISLCDANGECSRSGSGAGVSVVANGIDEFESAIAGEAIFEIADATRDQRFANSSLVMGPFAVHFYAGAPLRTSDNHRVGTLSLVCSRPRQLTQDERQSFADLAAWAEAEIHQIRLLRQQQRLAEIVSQTTNGVIITDKAGVVEWINAGFTRITGYELPDMSIF